MIWIKTNMNKIIKTKNEFALPLQCCRKKPQCPNVHDAAARGSKAIVFHVCIFSCALPVQQQPRLTFIQDLIKSYDTWALEGERERTALPPNDSPARSSERTKHSLLHVNFFHIVFWYVGQVWMSIFPSLPLSKNSIKVQSMRQQRRHESAITASSLSVPSEEMQVIGKQEKK